MTCRHSANDPDCSANGGGFYSKPVESKAVPATPDKKNYEVMEAGRVGPHLVLRVKYPNCFACAYEGHKVMVFLHVTEVEALKWREIDPHFRDPKAKRQAHQAPPPAARFPANEDGWSDAIDYATRRDAAMKAPRDPSRGA